MLILSPDDIRFPHRRFQVDEVGGAVVETLENRRNLELEPEFLFRRGFLILQASNVAEKDFHNLIIC